MSTLKAHQEERWAKMDAPTVKPPPPDPEVLEPEHEVSVDELPRGPKAVARAAAAGWKTRWSRVVSEELRDPIRGGECYGLAFVHLDGRRGWATWHRGKYESAFLYDPRGPLEDRVNEGRALVQRPPGGALKVLVVPQALKAKELKEVLAHG